VLIDFVSAVGDVLSSESTYINGALFAALLAYESTMVSPTDLGRLQKAFFDMNGYVSVALLIAVSISYVLG